MSAKDKGGRVGGRSLWLPLDEADGKEEVEDGCMVGTCGRDEGR